MPHVGRRIEDVGRRRRLHAAQHQNAPSEATKEIHQRAGEAEWLPQQRHEGENLGDAPIELIAVVPKAR